ncbi:hypothetical protein ACQZV8_09840 [Magnetococcales bacterium HHB-1]
MAKIGIVAGKQGFAEKLFHAVNHQKPDSALLLRPPERDQAFTLHGHEMVWQGHDIIQLETLWLQSLAYENPPIPSAVHQRDWSLWQIDYLTDQQRYSALLSLWLSAERQGVRVINPVAARLRSFMRSALLIRLHHAGFLLPEFIITNDLKESCKFRQCHNDQVVWRPASGYAAWQLFKQRQERALIDSKQPPILLAEIKSGAIIRIYAFQGKPLLALNMLPPQHTPPQEQLEQFWPVDLSVHHQSWVEKLFSEEIKTDLWGGQQPTWMQITAVVDQKQLWIYDIETDPQPDDLPATFQELLAQRLSLALHDQPWSHRSPTTIQERDSMLLRRMYRILFEYEESKKRP